MKRLHIILILALTAFPMPALAQKKIESQTGINDLGKLPSQIFKLLIFLLPAVTTIYFMFAGYRYIVAQGNQDLTEKAKKSLTYAAYGVIISYISVLVIILLADTFGTNLTLTP